VRSLIIVEDEAVLAMDLSEQLQSRGFEVRAVIGDSENVAEAVRTHAPSAVLMDIKIRGEADGITLAEELFVCEDTPVVFLTAYSEQELLARAAHSGAYGYLTKPVAIATVASTLELAIEKHADLRARRLEAEWLNVDLDVAAVRTSAEGRVESMNRAAIQMFGRMPLEIQAEPPKWLRQLEELPGGSSSLVFHELALDVDAPALLQVKVSKYRLRRGGSLCLIHRV
jgi:AmiR/NasT family two-component response regulator